MKVVAAVAVAVSACGSAPPPATLGSEPAATPRAPILLYLEDDSFGLARLHWISADGSQTGTVASGELTALRDPVVTPGGVWLEGSVPDGHAQTANLVFARRTGPGVTLVQVAAPKRSHVSPDGTQVVVPCPSESRDHVCVAPLSPAAGVGTLRHVGDAGNLDDEFVAWRGAELVVGHPPIVRSSGVASAVPTSGQPTVSYEDPSRFLAAILDPASGRRRELGVMPGGDRIVPDPSGTAFAIPALGYQRVRVAQPDHPHRGFVASSPQERGWALDRWLLVTPTTLLCGEHRGIHADVALVAFTPNGGRHTLAKRLASLPAAIAGHAAFVDGNELVATDLAGARRTTLLEVPIGSTITPVAWLP